MPHRLTCDELLAITDYTEDARLLTGWGRLTVFHPRRRTMLPEANMQPVLLAPPPVWARAIAGEAVSTGHMTAARRTQILSALAMLSVASVLANNR
ncbi:phage regulatory CII family protein [Salmonella enterica subsp. enterica]|nr:phage regulatory CII family protein [Salmonella enterica subsp. enterica]